MCNVPRLTLPRARWIGFDWVGYNDYKDNEGGDGSESPQLAKQRQPSPSTQESFTNNLCEGFDWKGTWLGRKDLVSNDPLFVFRFLDYIFHHSMPFRFVSCATYSMNLTEIVAAAFVTQLLWASRLTSVFSSIIPWKIHHLSHVVAAADLDHKAKSLKSQTLFGKVRSLVISIGSALSPSIDRRVNALWWLVNLGCFSEPR